ncbi:MAG TPA: hypothetical protein VH087_17770, partial [Thermoanaerobaculia bacterium]|nr:hypothetical protein [Thermoanaerobaculia bacterium]
MTRYSLLALVFTAAAATAQPLQFGPATRVAPFTTGTPGNDYWGAVAPRVNGFAAYWEHNGELWSESLSGSPPRPDLVTAHPLGMYADAIAETVSGPITVYSDGISTFVRTLDAPASAATLVGAGAPDGIECNATRCLVSINAGRTLAVVDSNAQRVSVVSPPPEVSFRVGWATDPDGFLVLFPTVAGIRAFSVDNNGAIRADVKIDGLDFSVATFNGDRYAIFSGSSAGLRGATIAVDGRLLSPPKTVIATAMRPETVAWNGSEDLLVGSTDSGSPIPEVLSPTALSGFRIAPDLTPIGQLFLIAPPDGDNSATSAAWNGNMFYVVWTHTIGSLLAPPNLIAGTEEGAAISATGDVVARDLLSWGPVPQTWPLVAQGASSSLVVWSELDIRSGMPALRYGRNGNAITAAAGFADDVVALGDDYLILWDDLGVAHAAILSSGGKWSEVVLPPISYGSASIAANHDHWLIAESTGANLVTATISRDGTVSAPKVIAELPYLVGLASDGDRFFLAAQEHDFILDATGAPILDKTPHFAALQVDFAGGVYGALSGGGTLDRYDRDGNFLGS